MNLIFDFDGTICDSLGATIKIANKFLQDFGEPQTTAEEVRNVGVKEIIKQSKILKTQIAKYMLKSRKEFSKIVLSLHVIPNIPKVVKILSKKHTLGILTSNSKKTVEKFLINEKLDRYFHFVYSEVDVFGKHNKLRKIIKKCSLDPTETFYIGDETRDIEAAKKAGIKSVAATWGYESEEVLRKANSNVIINNPKELLKIFG